MMKLDALVNDFAVRSFRDIGDGDYLAARMACRAALVTQFLWAAQQALEKYLKCILLLNRIEAKNVRHDLGKALRKINGSGKVLLDLTPKTKEFIAMLDKYGRYRYLEISNLAFGADLVTLDRAVWELRRYCTLAVEPREKKLRDGFAAPVVHLSGGHLERIINDTNNPARESLLWQNGFFGKRARKYVRLPKWFKVYKSTHHLTVG